MSRLASDVRFRQVGDESVVLRQSTAEILVVNEVAGRILEHLRDGAGLDAIVERLVEEFEVAADVCRADVVSCLRELGEAGIVEDENGESPA